jgi:hypothetical protein
MKKFYFFAVLLTFVFSMSAFGQIRPIENDEKPSNIKAAPQSFEARYEGGFFGYAKKEKGTLKFDDENERLIFFNEEGREQFFVPYKSLLVIYPSSKKVQSGTGRAVGAIPFPGTGIGGGFLKKKKNYLIMNFNDPDVQAQGTMTFLIDTDELLLSVVHTLGEKAELTKRGDAYYRPRTDNDIL